uniref:Uncharacterized protein ycf23 n=1 Tax=Nitophyllum punctatum TaxID=158729 RepID=A0A4D6WUU7_9FLOR|nr:hypothetical protein [Nitophyllum punctatum]
MSILNKKLSSAFKLRSVIKVITGLSNVNLQHIIQITKASEIAGADYIDTIANPKVVRILKSLTKLPICVSSIDPLELYNCILAGADLVEIGNFDIFYKKNILFSSSQILELAIQTRALIKHKDISVTIPSTLNLRSQVYLAKQLEIIGVNIIQTEGFTNYSSRNIIPIINNYLSESILTSIYFSSISLFSTYVISKSVDIPVVSSSGINTLSSIMAFFYGAAGIGLGSSVKIQNGIYGITNYINNIRYGINFIHSYKSKTILFPARSNNKVVSYKNLV